MNIWTKKSIELANQRNYLDLLFKIYPMSVNLRRELRKETTEEINQCFDKKDSKKLLNILLSQDVFPIKDSYVAYLKRDKSAIDRNPNTVNRITGMLYDMGLDEIFDKTTAPKETNRQIGPLFKNWIDTGALGCKVTASESELLKEKGDMVFNGSDANMKDFANKYLGYDRNKGLDFLAKFNDTYILAEAKFLTDFGGHQNAQFADAISTMKSKFRSTGKNVKTIAILDGVLYIESRNKMYKSITEQFDDNDVIVSAVLLRDYLYSI
jgi:putative type II site-specific deoxyribonuclease